MLKLNGDLGPVIMNGIGELLESGKESVIGDRNLVYRARSSRIGDGSHTDDDEPDTARGSRLVVPCDAVANAAVLLGQVGTHRRHDDAVADFERTDAPR